MKFDQVIIAGSDTLVMFDHKRPRTTPYTARTIDGLGPTDVDVTLAQTSQGTGIYIGRREQLREITCNVYLNPNYVAGQTPESLREQIYRIRPINDDLSLDFILMLDGVEVAVTPVYVKRVEVSPFSKDTLLQIVLASTSGTFKKRTPVSLPYPAIDKVHPIFVNDGSAESGFKLEVEFTGPATAFGLRQTHPSSEMILNKIFTDPYLFTTGDVVEINTNIGQRGIWLTRGGVRTSKIGSLSPQSSWLSLYPGPNELTTLPVLGGTPFNWKLFEHTPKYKGV